MRGNWFLQRVLIQLMIEVAVFDAKSYDPEYLGITSVRFNFSSSLQLLHARWVC